MAGSRRPQRGLGPAHADAQERDVVGRHVVGEEVAEQGVGHVLDAGRRVFERVGKPVEPHVQ